MQQRPKENEIYRHFKGNTYQVLTIALQTETQEELVIYRNLYHPEQVYARPIMMFLSEVDHEKYPECKQQHRFEKMDHSGTRAEEPDTDAGQAEDNASKDSTEESCENTLSPIMVQFLDADTYEEKLELYERMKNKIDDEMISIIAASLDIEVREAPIVERYQEVKNCLITLEKYECNRLR